MSGGPTNSLAAVAGGHTLRSPARLAAAAIAVLLGAGVAAIMLSNDVRQPTAADIVLVPLVGWAFALSGFVAWGIREDNPIGPAMVATGLLWFAAGLYWSQEPAIFSIGHAFESFYLAGIVYVLLAFPAGRLDSWLARLLAVVVLLAAGPAEILFLLLGGHAVSGRCPGCPAFIFQVANAGDLARSIQAVQHASGLIAIVLSVGILIVRWRAASPPLRFAIAPVIWTGVGALPIFALWVLNEALGGPLGHLADVALDLTLVAIAVSFLVGVARTRFARSAVADLMLEIGDTLSPGALRAPLARALHDPSLEIAYWLPDGQRFVDAQGRRVRLPGSEEQRMVTMIERDGRRIAALIHDPALEDERLVRSACAAAALALENERLQADLRAQLAEVQASRARIVEATQKERRRIERDLHDGTQQRLVSISMTLGLAAAKVDRDGPTTAALIADARAGLADALSELRELSQGIHPALLTERGLGPALDDLVLRTRMPVELDVDLADRLPEQVETAAYYIVAEALTNVAKYAGSSAARVHIGRTDAMAELEIADDGVGGADPRRGSGLRGLRDRVEALGGRFVVTSSPGEGTIVRAEIPCA